MNFIQRFRNGWRLFMASFDVMRRNKRLLLFPIATAVLTIVISAFFLAPIALQPSGHSYSESAHWKTVGSRLFTEVPATAADAARGRKTSLKASPQMIAYSIIFYFISMFLATFFNVAFVHEIFNALNGQPVSISDGLQFAGTKVKPILMWTMFAGLVGLLIRRLEEKFGFFGRWIVASIGLAWSVAAVFVIPVLVMEEHSDNPINVVRQSAGVIKKTWGEALGGYAGMQIGGIIGAISGMIAVLTAFYFGWVYQSVGFMAAAILAWFAFIIVFSYVMSVSGQIYLCMLYRYASTGTVPDGFTPEMLNMAWKPKKA